MSEDKFAEALKELKEEVRRAVRIYVGFWVLDSIVLFIVLAKIAGMW
jgi:hypothetical protein